MSVSDNTKNSAGDESQSFTEEPSQDQARREFMKRCGRFAVFTAPAVTALLLMDGRSNPSPARS